MVKGRNMKNSELQITEIFGVEIKTEIAVAKEALNNTKTIL